VETLTDFDGIMVNNARVVTTAVGVTCSANLVSSPSCGLELVPRS
jgi:hypothetical protein